MHQFRRGKPSEYSIRLREKQKVKRYYGIFERQFRKYFELAGRRSGNTGDALMAILERRLDNVVTRLGFATSRPQARQMITPRAHHRSTAASWTSPATWSAPATGSRSRTASTRASSPPTTSMTEGMPPVPDWLDRVGTEPPEGRWPACPATRISRCRSPRS